MIIISIGAGLGNQMFEYAFYRQLIRRYPDTEIKVDTRYAFPMAHNGIEIFKIFNLKADTASLSEVKRLVGYYPFAGDGYKVNWFVSRIIRRFCLYPKSLLIQKDFSEFYNAFFELNVSKDYYIYGPFANYRYFKDVEKEIQQLYIFPEIDDERNTIYEQQIKESESVSVHIRRGDYVTNGFQLPPPAYYDAAMKKIIDLTDNPRFFIFTDDVCYCEKVFPDNKRYVIVKGNTGTLSYRDMQLMSLCRHNIIANSTFSFWGAFLNRNQNRIIIAPNLPFSGCKVPFACDDWFLI